MVSARPWNTPVPECQHWNTPSKTPECLSTSSDTPNSTNPFTFLCHSTRTAALVVFRFIWLKKKRLQQSTENSRVLECQYWNTPLKPLSARMPAQKNSSASTETLKCQHWNTQVPAPKHSSASIAAKPPEPVSPWSQHYCPTINPKPNRSHCLLPKV